MGPSVMPFDRALATGGLAHRSMWNTSYGGTIWSFKVCIIDKNIGALYEKYYPIFFF